MWTIRSFLTICTLLAFSIGGLHCQSEAGSSKEAAGGSVVPVLGTASPFVLTDQMGRRIEPNDLRGKVWIAAVTSTRSRTNAPALLSVMHDLRDRISAESLWHSVRLLNIAAVPEHDTPTRLRTAAAEAGADSVHWRFVTGDRDVVVELVESLGYPLLDEARTPGGPITLTPQIVLVDRDLRVRGAYDIYDADHIQSLLADLAVVLPEAPHLSDGSGRTHVVAPAANFDLSWIEERKAEQVAAARSYDVFHDFSFTNRTAESRITFRNKIVDNAGKDWMPNHYDHGNGLAVADVDGDGLLDLYFVSQVGGNELWRNVGDGTFEDISARAGVSLDDRIGVTASFADIDNDGDPDLYVTTVKGGNALFENDGTGKFTDVSEGSGIDYTGHSSAAVFFDYDRDGLLDLFLANVGVYTSNKIIPVTNGSSEEQSGGRYTFYEGLDDAFSAHIMPDRAERSLLFKNMDNGRFRDVTEEIGLIDESWSGDASPIDVNGDGWQDLYILNMQGDDQYFENEGGEGFVRKSRAVFPNTPWGSMGIKSFDYNNDGRMDLYLTDMHSDMSESVDPDHEKHKSDMQWPDTLLAGGRNNIFGNAFFEHTPGGEYDEISEEIGAENYWPWGLSVGDLNADGYEDVFIAASMNYPFRYGVNSVLLNDQGARFLDSEYVLGVEPRRGDQTLTPWMDLDCANEDRGHEYCHGQRGDVRVWGSIGSRSSVVVDLDNDGDLDIVTNDFNSEPLVLVSDLSERKEDLRFLKIRLVGTDSNRDGLGAHVTVEAGGRTFTRVMDGVTGYLSHGIHPLYLGLGDATSVDRVEVRWPSGKSQVLEGPIETNSLLEVIER